MVVKVTQGETDRFRISNAINKNADELDSITGSSFPSSYTDNAIVRWNTGAGAAIQNSGVIITDANALTVPNGGSIVVDTITISDNGNNVLTLGASEFYGVASTGGVQIGTDTDGPLITTDSADTVVVTSKSPQTETNFTVQPPAVGGNAYFSCNAQSGANEERFVIGGFGTANEYRVFQVTTGTGSYHPVDFYGNASTVSFRINANTDSSVYFAQPISVGANVILGSAKSSVVGDANIASDINLSQLIVGGSTDTNERLYLGYDTTNNRGVIQAGTTGTGYDPLYLNQGGGLVTIGTGGLTLGGALTYGGVTLTNAVTGTGKMVLDTSPTLGSFASDTHTITSTSASALAVGRQGATDPVLKVNASTASVATGISITGAAAAGGVAVAAISSGTNENLTVDAKGSGTITLGGTSTGAITLTRATTMSAALTYGGVTLTNAVTGTGKMVLDTSPTIATASLGSSTATTQSARDNSTKLATTAYVDTATREKLSAARTYYVRTDGSDSNNGLANTAGGAFLTIQKAIDVTHGLDINGYTVTINVADGTYTAGVSVTRPFVGGDVYLYGNTTTPGNCVINLSNGTGIYVVNYAALTVGGFKITPGSGGYCMVCKQYGLLVALQKMEYGTSTIDFYCTTNGTITVSADYNKAGNTGYHIACDTYATVNCYNRTVTTSATPVFSSYYAFADNLSFIYAFGNTYTGGATGTRYLSRNNSVINVGGSATYFPGDVAGSTSAGGQYV